MWQFVAGMESALSASTLGTAVPIGQRVIRAAGPAVVPTPWSGVCVVCGVCGQLLASSECMSPPLYVWLYPTGTASHAKEKAKAKAKAKAVARAKAKAARLVKVDLKGPRCSSAIYPSLPGVPDVCGSDMTRKGAMLFFGAGSWCEVIGSCASLPPI